MTRLQIDLVILGATVGPLDDQYFPGVWKRDDDRVMMNGLGWFAGDGFRDDIYSALDSSAAEPPIAGEFRKWVPGSEHGMEWYYQRLYPRRPRIGTGATGEGGRNG